MLSKFFVRSLGVFLVLLMIVPGIMAQNANNDNDYNEDNYQNYGDRARIDRYLDVELWTNHTNDEFYIGDNITMSFRANRDAFISIYSIDTKGRVNLLFPMDPTEDNFIRGGVTYTIPSGSDDFDLEVNGPEGVEYIQIIASREKFPIPDWYRNSGMVCDWESSYDFMDYVNDRFFVRYAGQKFAYDRLAVMVNEWEPDYYRPVYVPTYPAWSVCGNVYIDYPWGSTVYINGVYWGCTPLYIPRLLVGWHTITIYDDYGWAWESDFHCSRYHTVIFDNSIVHTKANFVSRYQEVRKVGYRNPVNNGYPNFKEHVVGNNSASNSPAYKTTSSTGTVSGSRSKTSTTSLPATSSTMNLSKNYVRSSARMVKTDRGYEAVNLVSEGEYRSSKTGSRSAYTSGNNSSSNSSSGSRSYRTEKSTQGSSNSQSSSRNDTYKGSSRTTQDYYQRKSGTTSQRSTRSGSSTGTYQQNKSSGSSSGNRTYRSTKSTNRSSGTTQNKVQPNNSRTKTNRSTGSYKRTTNSSSTGSTKTSRPAVKNSGSTSTKSSSGSKTSRTTTSKKSGGSKR